MVRFRVSSLLVIVLLASCGAVQPSRQIANDGFSGTCFDVDIKGSFFVVDGKKNLLRKLSADQLPQKEVGGTGWSENQFDQPAAVWARNGIDVFVADYGNHRIQRFDRNLAFVSSFSTRDRSNPEERFGYPTDVAVSRQGDLFICDSENSRILKVTGLNNIERTFGGFDAGKGRLRKPGQLEIGPNDNIYVLDGDRVVVFDNFGNFIQILGEGVLTTSARLFGDDIGITILDGDTLLFFDNHDRLTSDVSLSSVLDLGKADVLAHAFSRGRAYFLTTGGIMTAPDPRATRLDEERN